jgi:hypothetical protein
MLKDVLISFSSTKPEVIIIFVFSSKMVDEKCFLIEICTFEVFDNAKSVLTHLIMKFAWRVILAHLCSFTNFCLVYFPSCFWYWSLNSGPCGC